MKLAATCSWCHTCNDLPLFDGAPTWCRVCGHDFWLPRMDCACPKCARPYRPEPLTASAVEAVADLLARRGVTR